MFNPGRAFARLWALPCRVERDLIVNPANDLGWGDRIGPIRSSL